MRLRRCAHGNLLRSTHERARMRCMGGLAAAHLQLVALSCSRCEQLPKTLLADAARERRAPAFLARVARFGRVNSSIHTRGRPLSKSTRNMFSNLSAMPTDVWATKKNAPVRGRFQSTISTSEVHFVLWGAQSLSVICYLIICYLLSVICYLLSDYLII